jgi:hypothetical protein
MQFLINKKNLNNMNSEEALLQKLQISKQIMQKHNNMGRNTVTESLDNNINVDTYEPVKGTYNIPQEYLSEDAVKQKKQNQFDNTEDKILNSRLPDEIKRLMIEHPIQQPSGPLNNSVLSDDLVEKASRLMNINPKGDNIGESKKQSPTIQNKVTQIGLTANDIKNIVKETVEDVLRDNGLLTESESSTNDIFKFRVGQHIFEGKLLKVKKIAR